MKQLRLGTRSNYLQFGFSTEKSVYKHHPFNFANVNYWKNQNMFILDFKEEN